MQVVHDMEMERKMKEFVMSEPGVKDYYLDVEIFRGQNRYRYKIVLWIDLETYKANNLARKITNEPTIEEVLTDIARSHREPLTFKYYNGKDEVLNNVF